MKTQIFIVLYLLINCQTVLAAKGININAGRSLILNKVPTTYPFETSITLKMPPEIKIKMWVTCFYYDKGNDLISETNHVLNSLTPTWKVQSPPGKISFVICTGE